MAINGDGNQPNADQKDLQPNADQTDVQEDARIEADESSEMMPDEIVSSEALERIARIALVRPEMARGVEDDILRAAQIGQIVGKVSTCSIGLAPAEEEKYQDDGFKFYDNAYEEHQSYSEVEGLLTDLNAHTAAVDHKSEDDGDIAFLTTVCHQTENKMKVEDDCFSDGFEFYDIDFCSGYDDHDAVSDDHDAVYDDHFDWDQPEDYDVYLFDGDVAILGRHFNWDQPEDDEVYLFDEDLAILTAVCHQADEADWFGDGFRFYDFDLDTVDDDHFDWDQPEDDDVYLFFGDLAILTTIVHHQTENDESDKNEEKVEDIAFCSCDTCDGSESEDQRLEDSGFGDGFHFYDICLDAVGGDHFDWDQPEDDDVYLFDDDVAILDIVRHFDWDQPEDDDVYLFVGDLAILTTIVYHQAENESDENEEKVKDSAWDDDHFDWDQPEDDGVYLFDGDIAILTTVRPPED